MCDKIEDKETLDDYLHDWSILLNEQMNIALDTNWGQKFLWETAISWDCFQDEVNRINNCITLHDELATVDSNYLMFAITKNFRWMPLYDFTKEELEEFKEQIDKELAKDRGY